MNARRLFLVCAALAILGAVAWRLVPSRALVVGVLAPRGTTPGDGIVNGAQMAVDAINAAGGVDGRTLALEVVDTGFSAEAAAAGYTSLAQRGAVAVVGVAGDGAFAIMPRLKDTRTPFLCTGTGADRLTDMVAEDPEAHRAFFRVMHKSGELADTTTRFAVELLAGKHGLRKFALLVEQGAWTDALRERWQAELPKAGLEVVWSDHFAPTVTDFYPIFTEIRASGAEYVLDASSVVEATQYLKQWVAVQGPPIGAIPTGAGTKRYYDQVGERGISVASVSTIPSKVNQATAQSAAWWEAYRARFGDPEYTSAYTYDAVHLLARAIEAGGTEPDALVRALEQVDHEGVAGRWVFGPDHHPRFGPGYRTIPMIQYQEPGPDGYRIVWPPDRAQAGFLFPPWWSRAVANE